jgi:hypothetical protein
MQGPARAATEAASRPNVFPAEEALQSIKPIGRATVLGVAPVALVVLLGTAAREFLLFANFYLQRHGHAVRSWLWAASAWLAASVRGEEHPSRQIRKSLSH